MQNPLLTEFSGSAHAVRIQKIPSAGVLTTSFSHQRISERGPYGPPSRGIRTVPVFLRSIIATCDFPGGRIQNPVPRPHHIPSGSAHELQLKMLYHNISVGYNMKQMREEFYIDDFTWHKHFEHHFINPLLCALNAEIGFSASKIIFLNVLFPFMWLFCMTVQICC